MYSIACEIFDMFAQDQLDQRLTERQARAEGICPVREDLYRQAFGRIAVDCA